MLLVRLCYSHTAVQSFAFAFEMMTQCDFRCLRLAKHFGDAPNAVQHKVKPNMIVGFRPQDNRLFLVRQTEIKHMSEMRFSPDRTRRSTLPLGLGVLLV